MSKLLFARMYGIECSFNASKNEYRLHFYDNSLKNSGIAIGIEFTQGQVYINIYAKTASSDWTYAAYVKLTNV